MALGVLQVMAEHGVLSVANTAVVPGILLIMFGLCWGLNALELRWPQGLAIGSRRQLRMVTGLVLGICAVNVVALAPNNEAAAVLGSVLATGTVWWMVRAALCRATAPVATPRGRQVIANLQAREHTIDERPPHDLAAPPDHRADATKMPAVVNRTGSTT